MLWLFPKLGGAGQGPLRGGIPKESAKVYFPLQSLLYLSRDEKLSRKNKKLLHSDGRNCPEVFLDALRNYYIIVSRLVRGVAQPG